MTEKRISRPEDFRNLAVYESPDGEARAVVFRNREMNPAWHVWLLIVLTGSALVWFLYSIFTPGGMSAGAAWLTLVAVLAGAMTWGMLPYRTRKRIEILPGNRLRVLKNGRLEFESGSGLANLTIEEHPEAALERQRRRGEIGPMQQQHCLVGWFGTGGAERVTLATRFEKWPPQNSLFEVRQAILWAIQQARRPQPAAAERAAAAQPAGEAAAPAATIRPPLD